MPRISYSAAMATAVLALLAAGASLSGCIVAAGGVGVAGYAIVGEDLSPEQQVRDYGIKANVLAAWGGFNREMAHRLDATVFNGDVLITGRVPDRHWRAEAARRARGVSGVRRVFDEIEVGPDTHFIDEARDTWITTQLRGELVGDLAIKSINYTIKTFDRVVYVMGFARTQPELDKVIGHARTVAGVRRVTPFIRVLATQDVNGLNAVPEQDLEAPPPGNDEDMNGHPPSDDDMNGPPPDEDEDQGAPPPSGVAPAPPPGHGGIKVEPLGSQ